MSDSDGSNHTGVISRGLGPIPHHRCIVATERACTVCREVKPYTSEFFLPRARSGGGYGLRAECRVCKSAKDKKRAGRRRDHGPAVKMERASDGEVARATVKFCPDCAGLPWRVQGPKCKRCGVLFEAEARPELELRRTREVNA